MGKSEAVAFGVGLVLEVAMGKGLITPVQAEELVKDTWLKLEELHKEMHEKAGTECDHAKKVTVH